METTNTLLIATRNPGKRREFESLLGGFINPLWHVVDVGTYGAPLPEVVEDAETFHGNAIKKALEMSVHSGAAAISDDSGLEVDALDGRPGVRSARFAGPAATDADNNRKLVEDLRDVPPAERTARYRAAVALALPDTKIGRALLSRTGIPFAEVGSVEQLPREAELGKVGDRVVIWFSGTVEGRIITEPRGSGGFGYDPYFYIDEWEQTMAEVPLAKKNTISHRAEALGKLARFFQGNP